MPEFASFVGTLVPSFPGVEFGLLNYHRIEADELLNLSHGSVFFVLAGDYIEFSPPIIYCLKSWWRLLI